MNYCRILRAAVVAFAFFGGLAHVPLMAQPPAKTRALPPDSAVRTGTLPNGLRYYVRANRKPEHMAELRLVVRAGSNQEDDDQQGLAHFVEHMAFNGTQRFAKHQLVDYLESIGVSFGADLNASTTFDNTTYQFRVSTQQSQQLVTAVDILAEWAGRLTFDSLEVVAERGVILEEWRRSLGAGTRIRDQQIPVMYQGSQYAKRNPIGLPSVIETANPGLLKRFYRDWYRPNLMAVVVVGDFDPDHMVTLVRERFSLLTNPANERARLTHVIPDNVEPIVSVVMDTVVSTPSISVMYKFPQQRVSDREQLRNSLIWNILSAAINQRMSEAAQVADPPFLGARVSLSGLGEANYAFTVTVSPRPDATVSSVKNAFAEIERVARFGITDVELDRIRTVLRQGAERRHTERAKIQSGAYADQYISAFLQEETISDAAAHLALFKEVLPTVTSDDIQKTAELWRREENRVVLMTFPKRRDVLVPDTESVLGLFASVKTMQLAAHVERPVTKPVLDTLPTPGTIVKTRTLEQGVTEWTLSNGIRVLLRPSTYTTDQVVIQGESPGGYYLDVATVGLIPASTAGQLVSMSGMGSFSATELGKLLAGRAVRAGATIGPFSEQLGAGAIWSDVETAFQLMYLAATRPRIDSTAINAYLAQSRVALANQGYSPERAFQDTVRFTMAQYHPSVTMPPATVLDSIDLQKSLAVFKDRFADMSDFRFVIVGNFSLDSMAPLVTRYLGALPGGGRRERFRDPGIRPPGGVVEKTVVGGSEPKTTTIITFHGDFVQNRKAQWDINALAAVMQMRLHARLREDMSGTYSVQVQPSVSRIPTSSYAITISFVSAPDRAAELTAAAFAVLDTLRLKPALADDVNKIRETQLQAFQRAMETDEFWLSRIALYDQMGIPFSEITIDSILRDWSPQDVQAAARLYLDTSRYTHFELVPEPQAAQAP